MVASPVRDVPSSLASQPCDLQIRYVLDRDDRVALPNDYNDNHWESLVLISCDYQADGGSSVFL